MLLARTFSAGDVERLTGVDNDTQRDWRRHGFLEELGETKGSGRWSYNLRDMITFYVAKRLMESGMDRFDASYVAAVHSETVEALMQARPTTYRFVARMFLSDRAGGLQPQDFQRFSSFEELGQTIFDRAEVIDLWWLAKTAPEDLGELARFHTPPEPAD